jgi:glycosyltransferase involved in cell wall biosynthesis
MDDDLSCVHPKNAAFGMMHPKLNPDSNWHWAAEACKAASMVTLSTPGLVDRYAAHGRYRVLTNCVPESYLSVPMVDHTQPRRWGWAGALFSHPDDVPLLGVTAATLEREGFDFRHVGSHEGMGRALGLQRDPDGPDVVPFEDWPAAIRGTFEVGVAPITDTRFNRSKSWLKPLEYAALGIPWVASDLHEYRRLARFIPGRLVKNRPKDWTREVRRLLVDDEAWRETSEAVRAAAADFTFERHAERWLDTWNEAWLRDHARAPQSYHVAGSSITARRATATTG